MRRIILFLFMLLFLPALCLAAPAIRFENSFYDFGIVGGRDSVLHSFAFSNEGDQELVIKKLSPS